MVNRHLTGSHHGIKDWILQRLSAVLIIVFSVILLVGLFFVPSSYEGWQAFFTYIVVKIMVQLMVIAIVIHAWIGVKDIWMDYITNAGLRLFMHTATFVWLLTSFIYSIDIIWRA